MYVCVCVNVWVWVGVSVAKFQIWGVKSEAFESKPKDEIHTKGRKKGGKEGRKEGRKEERKKKEEEGDKTEQEDSPVAAK